MHLLKEWKIEWASCEKVREAICLNEQWMSEWVYELKKKVMNYRTKEWTNERMNKGLVSTGCTVYLFMFLEVALLGVSLFTWLTCIRVILIGADGIGQRVVRYFDRRRRQRRRGCRSIGRWTSRRHPWRTVGIDPVDPGDLFTCDRRKGGRHHQSMTNNFHSSSGVASYGALGHVLPQDFEKINLTVKI